MVWNCALTMSSTHIGERSMRLLEAAQMDKEVCSECEQHTAGGHKVPQNHSLAHEHYLDAHDAGHWRAPHALALVHQRGWGVPPNCTKAQYYMQTFIKERSSWSDQMDEAVLAVDAGQCQYCPHHFTVWFVLQDVVRHVFLPQRMMILSASFECYTSECHQSAGCSWRTIQQNELGYYRVLI